MESELFRSLGLFVNKRQLATEKCAGRRKQLTKKYVWRVAILVMHPFSHHRLKIYFILKQIMRYCLTTRRLREIDATPCVSTSLLSFNTISLFVCVFSASFTCSLVKFFSCARERKEKEHVICLLSEIET